MKCMRPLAIVAGVIVTAQVASAQDTSRYRTYALESTLETVVAGTGGRVTDVTTLHERPAKIQELEWRAPYRISGHEPADPVRDIAFTFFDGALYQIVVSYDRDRTDGLTNSDIIASLSTVYGNPALRSAKTRMSRPAAALPDATVVAHWEDASSLLVLVRGTYSPEFQLILISKPLSTRAQRAIAEAIRLETIEAPRRELEQRKQEAAAASAAREKTRTTNKTAFRP
jgi:hypothetical protein